MRKNKDSNLRMKELWIELISTLLLFIAMVVIVVMCCISVSKIKEQNKLLSDNSQTQIESTLNLED